MEEKDPPDNVWPEENEHEVRIRVPGDPRVFIVSFFVENKSAKKGSLCYYCQQEPAVVKPHYKVTDMVWGDGSYPNGRLARMVRTKLQKQFGDPICNGFVDHGCYLAWQERLKTYDQQEVLELM